MNCRLLLLRLLLLSQHYESTGPHKSYEDRHWQQSRDISLTGRHIEFARAGPALLSVQAHEHSCLHMCLQLFDVVINHRFLDSAREKGNDALALTTVLYGSSPKIGDHDMKLLPEAQKICCLYCMCMASGRRCMHVPISEQLPNRQTGCQPLSI